MEENTFSRQIASDTPAFEGALEFERKQVPQRAELFPMQQVRLLPDSMYSEAHEWNRG